MRKHCRSRVRSRGKLVLTPYTKMVAHFAYAQPSEKWKDWNFRTISLREALNLVAAGEAEAVTREKDGAVQVVGYRALTPTSWERPSPASLTFATLNAVSNHVGEPKDLQVSRKDRMEYVKFKVWPLIGDTKAVAVRPRISDEDRVLAEKLLAPPVYRQRRCRQAAA